MPSIRVRQEGAEVLLIVDGRVVVQAPWNAGLELADAIRAASRKAEEIAKAEEIIFDNAILLRAGFPLTGLSTHRGIIAETGKEAAHNTVLRRHMPAGVKGQSILGTPSIRKQAHGKAKRR